MADKHCEKCGTTLGVVSCRYTGKSVCVFHAFKLKGSSKTNYYFSLQAWTTFKEKILRGTLFTAGNRA